MDLFIEKFKNINSYLLHLQYPERNAEDNWLHSFEIVNRILNDKTYIISKNYHINARSTSKWFQNFQVEIRDTNLVVYFDFCEQEISIGSFPLPLELPHIGNTQTSKTVQVDSFSMKQFIIEN